MDKDLILHFSVDDVLKSLIEISDKKMKLKDHWFFSFLYKIYKQYNLKISLYLFYQEKIDNKIRDLTEIRDLKNELKENWLFFGAHSNSDDEPLHAQSFKNQKKHIKKIYKQIERFSGKKYLASKVRFHQYSECYELSHLLKEYNVNTLFTTDKKIGSHRLNAACKKKLLQKGYTRFNNINFIRTDFRVENMVKLTIKKNINNIKNILTKKKFLIIYTHEYELKKKFTREKFLILLEKIKKNFFFHSDNI